ncbi:MAG: protein-L-isoaspartate(D-aspartate) O-methyltransferase [Anaerolineae bacterium]|nr:protein-L-isoaspartate(D-aspartate) O-methyltransferase [Anaerolineae bacterium]
MNDPFADKRAEMVKRQLRARGIQDERVLDAMLRIPRHEFVPPQVRDNAYRDSALPIEADQTISQPYMVALMTQVLHLDGHETVLEIGAGSGYQTAVLCELVKHVYSVERVTRLARDASERLHRLGYTNFDIHAGDGSQGLADMAPFDAIIVTAAAPTVPGPLRAQMNADGGRLVIPVGANERQFLELLTRRGDRWHFKRIAAVSFVPLIGRHGFEPNGTRS